jgi:hypothetical protein
VRRPDDWEIAAVPEGMWRNGNRPSQNAPEAGFGVGNPCWFGKPSIA